MSKSTKAVSSKAVSFSSNETYSSDVRELSRLTGKANCVLSGESKNTHTFHKNNIHLVDTMLTFRSVSADYESMFHTLFSGKVNLATRKNINKRLKSAVNFIKEVNVVHSMSPSETSFQAQKKAIAGYGHEIYGMKYLRRVIIAIKNGAEVPTISKSETVDKFIMNKVNTVKADYVSLESIDRAIEKETEKNVPQNEINELKKNLFINRKLAISLATATDKDIQDKKEALLSDDTWIPNIEAIKATPKKKKATPKK